MADAPYLHLRAGKSNPDLLDHRDLAILIAGGEMEWLDSPYRCRARNFARCYSCQTRYVVGLLPVGRGEGCSSP